MFKLICICFYYTNLVNANTTSLQKIQCICLLIIQICQICPGTMFAVDADYIIAYYINAVHNPWHRSHLRAVARDKIGLCRDFIAGPNLGLLSLTRKRPFRNFVSGYESFAMFVFKTDLTGPKLHTTRSETSRYGYELQTNELSIFRFVSVRQDD